MDFSTKVILSIGFGWFLLLLLYAVIIWFIVHLTQKRLHFIEIQEQLWCPSLFREIIHYSLEAYWCFFGCTDVVGSPAQTVASIIYKHLIWANQSTIHDKLNILDLCSGSCGPTKVITNQLNSKHVSVTTILTDLFPHVEKWKAIASNNKNIKYCSKSVDATKVNVDEIKRNLNIDMNNNTHHINLRTIFSALHHFEPDAAISILCDAMKCNDEFMSVEIAHRGGLDQFIQSVFAIVLLAPIFVIYMMKYYLMENKQLNALQKIYSIVLVIITTPIWTTLNVHDTIISFARCYKEKELLHLVQLATSKAGKKESDYSWKCWTQNSKLSFPFHGVSASMTVLYGSPTV